MVTPLTRRTVLILPLLVWSTWATAPAATAAPDRPNIVLIMTDDQGFGDLGFTGNPVIRTPNIDAMAARSAWMRNFYVSPVCAPTRACLMTGRYNYRTRCIDTYIGRAMMEPAEVTVAEVLRDAGYATGIFGKWHLGDNYPMRPHDQGFETALVHRGGGIGQPSDPVGAEGDYTDPILFRNGVPEQTRGYCTDVYYRNAFDFIEKARAEKRPFFVYLPDNCPHGPFHDVPEEDHAAYRKMDLGNDQFPQEMGHPLPENANEDKRARIFAMITNIDRNVGRLFEKLDALGVTDNTLVIFMCDNGPNGRRYVAGMKGMKSHVHEGGIRSPFFAHWPAKLKAGHVSDTVSAHIDMLPTLLDVAGVEVPAGLKLDGRSMLPDLVGEKAQRPSRTIFIQSHRGDRPTRYHHFMARDETWKLVHPTGFGRETFEGEPRFELYHMGNDPLEMHNVAADHPKVVARLKARYDAWFDDVGSTRPDNYAPPRIHVGTPHENPTVLTRQDWRHTQGRPWAANSLGHWLLQVAKKGTYDVHARFKPSARGGRMTLELGGVEGSKPLEKGASTVTFKGLTIPAGPASLELVIHEGSETRGVHQAEVRRE